MGEKLPFRYKHPHPAVAVDLVIFTLRDDRLQVLLIERGVEPFRGTWALPGGFMRMAEDLEHAARRELREETGLSQAYLEQVGAFGAPDRDPRERVISIAFFAIISADKLALQAGSDASAVAWHACAELPRLAFDHTDIIAAAKARLIDKINRTTLALQFLPPEFTLTELQRVFEAVRGEQLDKRNFRKWIEMLALMEPTGTFRRGGQHRPAALYRASTNCVSAMPRAMLGSPEPPPSEAAVLKADAYRKGFEDAVSAIHKAFTESEKTVLRSITPA
jgi:8-oxo-dGTP diphosphatase